MNIAIVSISNLFTRFGSVFLSILIMPLYLNILGPDAYGLIGVYNTLLVIVSFFDFGYSGVILQEAAKAKIPLGKAEIKALGNLVRTVEIAAILIAVVFPSIGYLVTTKYFKNSIAINGGKQEDIKLWVGILFIAATAKLPMGVYNSLLVGLNRQFVANSINFLSNIIRGGLTLFVISQVDSSLRGFFLSQLVSNLIEMCALMLTVWRFLPERFFRSSFNISVLIVHKKFASGIVLIAVSAAMVGQLDRLLLVMSVSMREFGYFTLASTIAGGILNLVYPFTSTLAPVFTRHRFESVEKTRRIYSQSTSVIILLVVPFALSVYLNSSDILIMYLGDPLHANSINPILKVLLIGTLPMTFTPIAHVLLVSHGKLKIISFLNLAYFLAYGIVLTWFSSKVELAKILAYWVVFNFIYFAVLIFSAYATANENMSGFFYWFYKTLLMPILWTVMCGVVVHYIVNWFLLPKIIKYFIEYTSILILCIASTWKSFLGVIKNFN